MDSSFSEYEKLRNIEQYVQEGTELTKQLLGVAREGKYEVKPTDLNDTVRDSSQMFAHTKKEITIHTQYQQGIWIVEADPNQIQQALLNLYVNAWQAMPGGGELFLQTENLTLDEDHVKPHHLDPGKYVRISVTDTGVGMDRQTQEKIFDLFFTTDQTGKGTGLGLASVFGIVQNHGGFMNVYSEKGEGTTFNIYLPVSEGQIIEEDEFQNDLLTGSESILLVDDEDMIITVGSEMLSKLGYEILIAKNGSDAIELCKTHKDAIDMVILDMIMPDMSGEETYERIKEIMPNVKVLLSSGYSIVGQAKEMLERGCNGFIQKPFNMRRLSQKIRELLN
jgi:two-component system, cell cycle sensor histidine kinase and response regulator CckA